MNKRLPWIFVGLAFLAVIYLFVLLLNTSVALDDARAYSARLRERGVLALSIEREGWVGKDIASVTWLSGELERRGVIVGSEGDGVFEIGDFIFETKDGVVSEVRYID